jgi:hypothetical protein
MRLGVAWETDEAQLLADSCPIAPVGIEIVRVRMGTISDTLDVVVEQARPS